MLILHGSQFKVRLPENFAKVQKGRKKNEQKEKRNIDFSNPDRLKQERGDSNWERCQQNSSLQ